jgi:hypothetical protein
VQTVGNGTGENLVWNVVQEQKLRSIYPQKRELSQRIGNPKSSMQYFRKMVESETIININKQRKLYSVQSDLEKPLNVTTTGIKQFIDFLLYLSIYRLPCAEMFWRTKTWVPQVTDFMSHNR